MPGYADSNEKLHSGEALEEGGECKLTPPILVPVKVTRTRQEMHRRLLITQSSADEFNTGYKSSKSVKLERI